VAIFGRLAGSGNRRGRFTQIEHHQKWQEYPAKARQQSIGLKPIPVM
jgi:hypothetical protein